MPRSKVWSALGLVLLLTAVAYASYRRRAAPLPAAELLPYQARASELPKSEREVYAAIRLGLKSAEATRARTKAWPATFEAAGLTWSKRGQGLYINYLGLPAQASQLRWLVLIIEPAESGLKDAPAPEDDEHHTLADGTALHVTLWSAPHDGPIASVTLPFPAAEGWVQRLSP